jgi:hypothetical protein
MHFTDVSWREERHHISEKVSDEITGHAPLTVGRGYGRPTLADMAAALTKFPRYPVEPESPESPEAALQ